jgi:MoxR-like ATPase
VTPVLQARIQALIQHLSAGMHEREDIIAVSLLGALSGLNTFLYGPPGTAKSLIARRMACGFEKPAYFECLMNRFSTPEEIFGPVSIRALKEDQYVRKTQGYLPTADFAFLDEIWKSSPAILNALLTLINERLFRNGDRVESAPLKALIAASNEVPDVNQGLDALYDRFTLRLMVGPIEQADHFDLLLDSAPASAAVEVPEHLRIKPAEWLQWRHEIQNVKLSRQSLDTIHRIRHALESQRETLQLYVSDRRWQRAATLMKASAFFNDRSETQHSDTLLLQHCLWTSLENRVPVAEIVAQAIQQTGFEGCEHLAEMDQERASLDHDLHEAMFHSDHVYKTHVVGGKSYFRVTAKFAVPRYRDEGHQVELLIPLDKARTCESFNPLTLKLGKVYDITGKFDEHGVCGLSFRADHELFLFTPDILARKGERKPEVDLQHVQALTGALEALKLRLQHIVGPAQAQARLHGARTASPFVPDHQTAQAHGWMLEQLGALEMRIKDCERLEALCH